jgi:hypothetical protein
LSIEQIALLAVIGAFFLIRRSLLASAALIVVTFAIGFNLQSTISVSAREWDLAILIIIAITGIWGIATAHDVA